MLSYRDMFDYFKKERARIIDALEKLPQKELERNREISFLSLKDVLIHTVMVEDNWLHYRAAGLGSGTSLKPEGFKNLQDIKKYIVEVDSKTAKLFSGMTEKDLGKEVRRTSREGREEVFTLEQILYHIPIEIIHHFGEIFAEFWKMDIDAPYYSYLAYSKDKMGNRST